MAEPNIGGSMPAPITTITQAELDADKARYEAANAALIAWIAGPRRDLALATKLAQDQVNAAKKLLDRALRVIGSVEP